MDIVAHLLAFVAKNFVKTPVHITFDEVAQKPVKFHAAVVRSGEASAAQTAAFNPKIAAVFLHHHIAGHFGSAENTVLALINRKFLGNAVGVSGVVIIPTLG